MPRVIRSSTVVKTSVIASSTRGIQLDGNERYRAIEETDDVEESGGNLFRDDDADVVVLGIATPLDVPVSMVRMM